MSGTNQNVEFDPNAFIVETQRMAKQTKKSKDFDPNAFITETQSMLPKEQSFLSKAGDQALGFAQGVSEAANIPAIPGAIERIGRTIPKLLTPTSSNESIFSKIGSSFNEANQEAVLPMPSIGDEAAIVRTGLRFIGKPLTGDETPIKDMAAQELASQKRYEKGKETANAVGQVAVIVPAFLSFVKNGLRAATKGAISLDSVIEKIKTFGREQGYSDALIDQSIKEAQNLKSFDKKGDRFLMEKAADLSEAVSQYKDMRSENYNEAMKPLLETKGKEKIPVDSVILKIKEVIGQGDNVSPALKKKLTELIQYDLNGKKEIDFATAQRIKQDISGQFGAYNKQNYLGQTPDDALAARSIINELKDSINSKIPEAIPINKEYSDASVMLDSLNEIIGKPKKRISISNGQKEQNVVFPKAVKGIAKTLKVNEGDIANTIDTFAKEYPNSQAVINDFKTFLAAKEIYTGSATPSVQLRVGQSGPSMIGRLYEKVDPTSFKNSIKILGFGQRPISPFPLFGVNPSTQLLNQKSKNKIIKENQ